MYGGQYVGKKVSHHHIISAGWIYQGVPALKIKRAIFVIDIFILKMKSIVYHNFFNTSIVCSVQKVLTTRDLNQR